MSMKDAFASVEVEYHKRVIHATFGHLAAKQGTRHVGEILFACGEYGDIVPIRTSFPTVLDNPWFFDAMQEFIEKKAKDGGTIYRFKGCYVLHKNGSGRFYGKVSKVEV